MTDNKAALAGIGAVKNFYRKKLKIGVTMKDYGIDGSKIETMADSAMKFRPLGSFVQLTREDLVEIYRKALG
jgi:alcohol dehydrogenase YqhD (iron-dependent ADH family)